VAFGRKLGDNSEQVFLLFAYEVPEKTKKKSTMRFHFTKKKGDKGEKAEKHEHKAVPADAAPAAPPAAPAAPGA